jgi:hypothetical protein
MNKKPCKRPVVRDDGMIGICTCYYDWYRIDWADGTCVKKCRDISYHLAKFVDIGYDKMQKGPYKYA